MTKSAIHANGYQTAVRAGRFADWVWSANLRAALRAAKSIAEVDHLLRRTALNGMSASDAQVWLNGYQQGIRACDGRRARAEEGRARAEEERGRVTLRRLGERLRLTFNPHFVAHQE